MFHLKNENSKISFRCFNMVEGCVGMVSQPAACRGPRGYQREHTLTHGPGLVPRRWPPSGPCAPPFGRRRRPRVCAGRPRERGPHARLRCTRRVELFLVWERADSCMQASKISSRTFRHGSRPDATAPCGSSSRTPLRTAIRRGQAVYRPLTVPHES